MDSDRSFDKMRSRRDNSVQHDFGGGGETTSPMSKEIGQKAAPGHVLVYCSTRTMECHETVGREGVLHLEQNLISSAPHSLLSPPLRATIIPISQGTLDVAKSTFLAVSKVGGNIHFPGKILLCGT